MRLFSGLFAGRESLISHGSALGVVANNLANSNSIGFKTSRADFQDLLAEGIGGLFSGGEITAGNGASAGSTTTFHSQAGVLEVTGRSLDVAIDGQGFFVVNDGTSNFFTRAGNFVADANGNLQTVEGDAVMGFTAASPDTLVQLNINSAGGQAVPTSTAGFLGNLDATTPLVAAPAAAPATFDDLNAASAFNLPIDIIDSIGDTQTVVAQFFHETNLGWTAQIYANNQDLGGDTSTPVLLSEVALTFDGTGNIVTDPATVTATPQFGNDSTPTEITFDFGGFTAFATESAVSTVNINGSTVGIADGIEFRENGDVVVLLSGGIEDNIGNLGIAKFLGVDGLQRAGDNKFIATEASGEAVIGQAGTEARGGIQGNSLESSIVDPSKEFVDLIRYQRGYQAGSSVISTINELLNTTIQIV